MSRDSISRQGSRYCLRGGKGKGGGPRSAFASPSLSSSSPSCHPFLKDGEASSPSSPCVCGTQQHPKGKCLGEPYRDASCWGRAPRAAGGTRAPRGTAAAPASCGPAGERGSAPFLHHHPPPNSPVKHPRGQVTAPPLSGVRVRRDKGSPVLGGEKSIRGERWCGAIRAEIPPQPQRQGEGRCVRTRPQSWGAARSPPVARGWPTVPPGSAPLGTPSCPSSPALI